jgi:hypothetical protein
MSKKPESKDVCRIVNVMRLRNTLVLNTEKPSRIIYINLEELCQFEITNGEILWTYKGTEETLVLPATDEVIGEASMIYVSWCSGD